MLVKLSDGYVRAAVCPPGSTQIEVPDDAAPGLALIVGTRAKTWFVRFRLHGKRHRYALGRYPAIGLAEARALAAAALLKVDRGEDPRAPVVSTVADAWDAFWAVKALTLKHPDHDLSCWRNHIEPHVGTLPLDSLSPLVIDTLQVKWAAAGLGPGQSRPLRLLTGLQGFLMDRDLIAKRFVPRRVARPAGRPLPVPPVAVVRALLAWCEGQGAPGAQLALLALLAARADMVQALRWDEVHDDHLSWSADRMKGARDFDQPLSTAAKAWLDRVPKVHPVYVFPARHGRTEAQIDLSKWTGKSPLAGYRTHDLRAAFATHTQEALGVSPSVIAATLDHSPASMLGVTSRYLKPGPRLM